MTDSGPQERTQSWVLANYAAFAKECGGRLIDRRRRTYRPLWAERLQFECERRHRWYATAGNIKSKRTWCYVCRRAHRSWSKTQMAEFARSRGGVLLSQHGSDPIQHLHRVRFRCQAGHEWEPLAGQVMREHTWCRQCFNAARRKAPDDLHAVARSRGGVLLGEGRNRNKPATWRCDKGHTFRAAPHNVLKGNWCPDCSASRSERIVRTHFEQIFGKPFPRMKPKWLRNDTGRLLELDGYCDELQLAFEHQGAQHYCGVGKFRSVNVDGIRRRDAIKRRLCRGRGITLIEVPELVRHTPLSQLTQVIISACRKAGVKLPRGAHAVCVNVAQVYATTQDDEVLAELHRLADSRGGTCFADKYLGAGTRLPCACAYGHEWMARPADVRQGSWCKRCASKAANESKRLTIEMMRQVARERGGECLSREYVDARRKLRWRCGKCKHEWDAPAFAIRRGQWCPPCGYRAGWERRRARHGPDGGNGLGTAAQRKRKRLPKVAKRSTAAR